MTALDPAALLYGYTNGVFPMAESKNDANVFWVKPKMRGILPLESLHISHSMRRFLKKNPFEIRFDCNFEATVKACADREETWINKTIFDAYVTLFQNGCAHSVECYENGELAGGLYGVSLKSAFFGESMFSRRTNASKTALFHLVEHLKNGGFTLLDTQFLTPHLASMGGIEIPQEDYLILLRAALRKDASF